MVHERVQAHVPSGAVADGRGRRTVSSAYQPGGREPSAAPVSAPSVVRTAPGPTPVAPSGFATAPVAEVPAEQRPLDPRAIARASLQASRNASLWWTAGGVVLAVVVSLAVGTAAGAWTLSAVLAAGAAVRGLRPSPGPVALSVRSRALDVVILAFLAVAVAVLATILPTPDL